MSSLSFLLIMVGGMSHAALMRAAGVCQNRGCAGSLCEMLRTGAWVFALAFWKTDSRWSENGVQMICFTQCVVTNIWIFQNGKKQGPETKQKLWSEHIGSYTQKSAYKNVK